TVAFTHRSDSRFKPSKAVFSLHVVVVLGADAIKADVHSPKARGIQIVYLLLQEDRIRSHPGSQFPLDCVGNHLRELRMKKGFAAIETNSCHSSICRVVNSIGSHRQGQLCSRHEVATIAATHTAQI